MSSLYIPLYMCVISTLIFNVGSFAEMASHGIGKTICNYATMTKKIVEEKYVVFSKTKDP